MDMTASWTRIGARRTMTAIATQEKAAKNGDGDE